MSVLKMNRAPVTTLQVYYCLWGGFIAVPAVGAFFDDGDLLLVELVHDVAAQEQEQDRKVLGVRELWVTETLVPL